jgi:hypothetical protein
MSRHLLPICVLVAVIASSGARAEDASAPRAGSPSATSDAVSDQAQAALRVAAPFVPLAGSPANAVALVTALRTGSAATLATVPSEASATPTLIVPPTKPMGWGNISHSLELAQFVLADAGIVRPTTAELRAALLGGIVTGANGRTAALPGVLKQRAAGMAWSEIAHRYGTTMRAFNRGGATARATMAADSGRVH